MISGINKDAANSLSVKASNFLPNSLVALYFLAKYPSAASAAGYVPPAPPHSPL